MVCSSEEKWGLKFGVCNPLRNALHNVKYNFQIFNPNYDLSGFALRAETGAGWIKRSEQALSQLSACAKTG